MIVCVSVLSKVLSLELLSYPEIWNIEQEKDREEKQRRHFLLEEQQKHFVSGGQKITNASGHQKMRNEKKKWAAVKKK